MPSQTKQTTQRRIHLLFALMLAGIFYIELTQQRSYEPVITPGSPIVLAAERLPVDRFEKLIREKPLAAMIEARDRHDRSVKDYRCTMVKQELLSSGMSPEQEIEVLHRLDPYSVVLHYTRNPGAASRAIYVDNRWIDADASDPSLRPLAVCEPENAAAKLLLNSIKMPIHGAMAKRAARRAIDEFGFHRTLDLLIQYCQYAQARNELRLTFCGDSRFDGRDVWVLKRSLPYTGEDGPYPDRTARVFVDKEYRVPIAVYCYSDDDEKPENLLGKYEYRNIRLNVGLTDADFEPATYGM